MATWTDDELERIDAEDELQIATRRRDGSLRRPVTIWMVRIGGELYVRSVGGPSASWFRGTRARQEGRIRAGGVERDVALEDAPAELNDRIDAAYRAKYSRYAKQVVGSILSPGARSTTLSLVPRATTGA